MRRSPEYPSPLRWTPEEVHVWRVPLDCAPDAVAQLRCLLDDDELERACRFHFERDRDRFTVGRARLRMLLARYLGSAAKEVNFRYGPAGKPELPPPGPPFSVSHSAGLMLIAVGGPGRLGVDIEKIRPRAQPDSFTGFFAPAEEASIQSLPADLRERAFFTCWTRKEAWIKGRGDGLSYGLDRFEVSVEPHLPAALLRVADHPEEVSRWELRSLDPGPGYTGTLAVEGHGWDWRCLDWEER